MRILRENYSVQGKYLDNVEDSANLFLVEMFPDTTTLLLSDYERVYDLDNSGTIAVRRQRVLTAMRAQGGLSKTYFEGLGNTLGQGSYTVSISEGTDNIGFIVAEYSDFTSPKGPATSLPGLIEPEPYGDGPHNITVTVTGVASAPELEKLYDRLKPSWTEWNYIYIP